MRFTADGPRFPDYLLEQRDKGQVVFLCGAGVSLSAGMPTFYELTKYVFEQLDPPKGSDVEVAFSSWLDDESSVEGGAKVPLDQIFNLFYQDYGRVEVDSLVAQRLDTFDSAKKRANHQIVSRISSDQHGNSRIVTTNFDTLFESSLGELTHIHEPPFLPNISYGQDLTGITYLHGRVSSTPDENSNFVLGSADFGRAYLSEAWATKFIRNLLTSYTVVLLGYQAEDPPVKYLLQGLRESSSDDIKGLYVFDVGTQDTVESKWKDRGVTPIACSGFETLWKSLELWAERSDDLRKWKNDVVEMSRKGPRNITPHERGQVAHLVRFVAGAKLFCQADPAPPVDWICVFDDRCRLSENGVNSSGEKIDLFKEYHLDDDPIDVTSVNNYCSHGQYPIIERNRFDLTSADDHRIASPEQKRQKPVPVRLLHLVNWCAKHVAQPVLVWWVCRQRSLHPQLLESLRYHFRTYESAPANAANIWRTVLEYHSYEPSSLDSVTFELEEKVKVHGWNSSVIREFASSMGPRLEPKYAHDLPIDWFLSKNWEDIGAQHVLMWEVVFPRRYGRALEVPDNYLEEMFRVREAHLFESIQLKNELGGDVPQLYYPTCYPSRDVSGDMIDSNIEFYEFKRLFQRLINLNKGLAKGHALTWPLGERGHFRRLKLFALNHPQLFEPNEVVDILESMTSEALWDQSITRELLFLVHDRWNEFSLAQKNLLIDRFLAGPELENEDSSQREIATACAYVKWLTIKGLEIPADKESELRRKIPNLKKWNESWAGTITNYNHGGVRYLVVDESPDDLLQIPLSDVFGKVMELGRKDWSDFKDNRPFVGLVKEYPTRALLAIRHEAITGNYDKSRWSELIYNWPKHKVFPLLQRCFLEGLLALPQEFVQSLEHPIGDWIKTSLVHALEFDEKLGWCVFDSLIHALVSGVDSDVEGDEASKRTLDNAINSPLGKATEGLLNQLDALNLKRGKKIPSDISSRLEELLSLPISYSDSVASVIARQLHWLNQYDSLWIASNALPWFQFDHKFSEIAWNGHLHSNRYSCDDLGQALNPLLLKLFPAIYHFDWNSDLSRVATGIIVNLVVFHSGSEAGVSSKAARSCLRSMNARDRCNAVHCLSLIGQQNENGWFDLVIPFVKEVWPKELLYLKPSLTEAWLELLSESGDAFPAVLSAVKRYFTCLDRERFWLHRFIHSDCDKGCLASRFPIEMLSLVDAIAPDNYQQLPYDIEKVLEIIQDSAPECAGDPRFLRLIDLVENAL